MKRIKSLSLVAFLVITHPHLQAQEGPEVVASKGEQAVTVKDLKFYARDRVPENRHQEFFQKPDAVAQLTENLLLIRVLAAEAKGSGLVDEELVEWQLDLHRQRLLMDAYLDQLVAAQTQDINWEATARDVYVAETESFQKPERVRAAHILIKTEERSDEEARALAEDILAQLKDGADFKLLAAKYSEDASAATNLGSLGTFGRGKMVPEFEKAAFELREPGELAGPVKSQFGYHVIKLEEYLPASQASFEEVKDEIVANLKQEIPNTIRQNKLMEIRSSEDIEVDQELLQRVQDTFRKDGVQ